MENQSASKSDMHQAAKADVEAVKAVYDRMPESVNELSELGHPPLYTAALYRNNDAVEFLLAHGARCDIFACAYLNRVSDARSLLQENPSLVNERSADGMTPLHYAARAGNADISALLIKHNADVNARDYDGGTPLLEACHGGPWKREPDQRTIELLLSHAAEIDLHSAAAMGRADLIEALLDADGKLIDDLNDRGQTPIYLAAKNNQLEAVKLLIRRGADPNLSDAVGTAALHRTSQECSDELIQYLIDNGANAHVCCYAACGDEDGLRAALERAPEAATEVFYEFSAVQYAIHCWQLGSLRILLQHGCRLTQEDQQHILRISNSDQELLADLMEL